MPSRPNIILFLADDHAPWTLPCYGNSEVRAPTFDGMARDGVVFENAFTPTPVCSPGRACLLTGLTSSQHGVHDFICMWDPVCQDRDWLAGSVTLAEMLQREGYLCGLSGKWHIGRCFEAPRGYEWYFGFPLIGAHIGTSVYVDQGKAVALKGNRTEITTDRAVDFIRTAPEDRPFFLQVGYTTTHSPHMGHDPEMVASYRDATFKDVRVDEPHPLRWNEGLPDDTPEDEGAIRVRHMNHYAGVSDVDQNVGRILEAVASSGRAENTVVVYTSDHGLSLGQNGFWGKGNGTRPLNMYDVSIGVPLLMTGPGLARGLRIDRCVDHFDTFQAICEICGVESGKYCPDVAYPGRSCLPLASGDRIEDWNDTRFGEYGDLRMVRTPQYKLVRRYPDGPDDLFDLEADPEETVNVIDWTDLADVRAGLEGDLDAFYAQYEDPEKSGLKVKELPRHNCTQRPGQKASAEAWRDGIRESRGMQVY